MAFYLSRVKFSMLLISDIIVVRSLFMLNIKT